MVKLSRGVRKAGSSCGAVVEVAASGVPAGWGAPVYGKLDQDLAAAMMSINAVKGVEIGAGFAAAAFSGEQNADEIRMRPRQAGVPFQPRGRHPGRHFERPGDRGTDGGEANVIDPHPAADDHGAGNETDISTKGRHDPCVGIRAVPVGEAMMALVLADHFLRHRAQAGREA